MAGGDTIVVKGYADLEADPKLTGIDADEISRELAELDGGREYLVAWAPDWILDEKPIEPVGKSRHVVSGKIEAETEKAYLIASGRDEAWLPKSVIRRFKASRDARLESPQVGISDFAGGRG